MVPALQIFTRYPWLRRLILPAAAVLAFALFLVLTFPYDVLAEIVANMPESSLPLLEDVEVTTTTVRVKGTADNFGKVDEIVTALRKNRCFGEIKQPRTERAPGGNKVSFAMEFPYTCSGETSGGA